MLQRIFKALHQGQARNHQTNDLVNGLHKDRIVSHTVKDAQLGWVDHVPKISNEEILYKSLNTQIYGKRRIGA